ncbi:SDR family oxidoreductase [Roseobacter sp. GAI101]|uniref:SDR family oxidoreductase n=1 Tax=Roseobacter sp. (strain GAI101) TaxID=391589 RepID=UPI0001871B60|nr:SDR family oxidoreductase [Roseobacter sp. GAI101]EEB82764.1 aldo-keto reductase family protein [Roseobacter sp. GAI101]
MTKAALVVGATGIQGSAIADKLVSHGCTVLGLARTPQDHDGVTPVAADLLDPKALAQALKGHAPTHVFLTTWLRQDTEAENIRVNDTMVRNLLDAVREAGSVEHVALVTGLKHYLGPFEAYGKGTLPKTPFREDQGRLDVANFYYAQEDEVFAAAERDGFGYSIHRPHTVIGKAVGNAMNMGTTLAVYAELCKATGRPFRFPGSQVQWESLTDMTDARQLADQVIWASTTPAARNEDFNIVNGDVFRWNWMWHRIGDYFGVEVEDFDGVERPLVEQMQDDAPVWAEIAKQHGLAKSDLSRLASAWHTDADLGRPIEVVTDMSKSRALGFTGYVATDSAFFDLFDRLRADNIIPKP